LRRRYPRSSFAAITEGRLIILMSIAPSCFHESSIACHEPYQHGCDQFCRLDSLTGFTSQHISIDNEITVYMGRHFDSELHWPVVGDRVEFQLELPRKRQRLWYLNDLDRLWRLTFDVWLFI
jgi:hypothetical protein